MRARGALLALGWTGVAMAALLAGCVVPDQHPQYVIRVSRAPLDPYWLWGNLTWTGDGGGISWDPNPTSDHPGGPAPRGSATEVQEMMWGSFVQRYTGDDTLHALPPADEFKSQPLPSDVHVNVSRPLQLDLILTQPHPDATTTKPAKCVALEVLSADPSSLWIPTTCDDYPCPYSLDVELYAGDAFIAGAVAGAFTEPALDPATYALPEGFIGCYYGLAIEKATLPAGAVLRLRILHTSQDSPFQYGLEGPVRSQLRIPFYSPEEWSFRDPATAQPLTTGGDVVAIETLPGASSVVAAGAQASVGLALAAAGSLLAAGLGPRSRRPLLVALVAVGFVLSGCLATKAKPTPAGPSDARVGSINSVLSLDGGISSGTNGSILGLVHDDLHLPLAGVHVSLLGTPRFTETDAKGRFVMADLPPATYRLRFELADYHGLEGELQVKAGFVTKVDILLRLVNAKVRDLRPHSHDYWLGANSLLAMDHNVQVTCDSGYFYDDWTWQYYYATSGTTCNPGLWFNLPPKPPKDDHAFNTVVPGTYEVEVALSWNVEATQTPRLGLLIQTTNPLDHPDCGSCWTQPNWTQYYPRGPNVPFHIQTGWESTDLGHDEFSAWRFRAYLAPTDYAGPKQAAMEYVASAAATLPSVHVKITIHKGALPLEPSHPDLWKGGSTFTVLSTKPVEYNSSPSCSVQTAGPETGSYAVYAYPVQPTKLVPYESTWLQVKYSLSRATSPPTGWDLYYHPANLPPPTDGWYSSDLSSFKKASTNPVVSGNDQTWKIPLTELEADGAYSKVTNWAFVAVPKDTDAYCADYLTTSYTLGEVVPYMYEGWNVVAHRDPMP